MVMFSGSSRRLPATPLGARALKLPAKPNVRLPDTSTCPPLPPSAPPSARTLP